MNQCPVADQRRAHAPSLGMSTGASREVSWVPLGIAPSTLLAWHRRPPSFLGKPFPGSRLPCLRQGSRQAPHPGQTCSRQDGVARGHLQLSGRTPSLALQENTALNVSARPALTINPQLRPISNLIPCSRKEDSQRRSRVDYYPIEVTQ